MQQMQTILQHDGPNHFGLWSIRLPPALLRGGVHAQGHSPCSKCRLSSNTMALITSGCGQSDFHQLCSGVAYMHKAGVCHRDLKLENLVGRAAFRLCACTASLAFHCISSGFSCLSLVCFHSVSPLRPCPSLRCCSCLTRPARYSS